MLPVQSLHGVVLLDDDASLHLDKLPPSAVLRDGHAGGFERLLLRRQQRLRERLFSAKEILYAIRRCCVRTSCCAGLAKLVGNAVGGSFGRRVLLSQLRADHSVVFVFGAAGFHFG